MEQEIHRLRTTLLYAVCDSGAAGISVDMVADVVEHELGMPWREFAVAECFPEDFAVTFTQPHLRDIALEQHSFPVRGKIFRLRPWYRRRAASTRYGGSTVGWRSTTCLWRLGTGSRWLASSTTTVCSTRSSVGP
jgi:hypothetical protein